MRAPGRGRLKTSRTLRSRRQVGQLYRRGSPSPKGDRDNGSRSSGYISRSRRVLDYLNHEPAREQLPRPASSRSRILDLRRGCWCSGEIGIDVLGNNRGKPWTHGFKADAGASKYPESARRRSSAGRGGAEAGASPCTQVQEPGSVVRQGLTPAPKWPDRLRFVAGFFCFSAKVAPSVYSFPCLPNPRLFCPRGRGLGRGF